MAGKLVQGIDHVALQVSDIGEGLRFFRDLLGFDVKYEAEAEGFKVYILQAGKIQLELWEAPGAGSLPRPDSALVRPGLNHIALAVSDLKTVLQYLSDCGYPTIKDIYSPTEGIREAVVLGPDNVEVQFIQQDVPLLIWRTIRGDFRKKAPTPRP